MQAPGGGFLLFARVMVAVALLALCAYLAFEAATGWHCAVTGRDDGCGVPALLYTMVLAVAGNYLWRVLRWNPGGSVATRAPGVPVGSAGGGTIRELQEGTLPEPADVPLPPGAGTVVETEGGLNIEFPVSSRVRGGAAFAFWGLILGAVAFGGAVTTAKDAVVIGMVALPVGWFAYLAMRERHRKCTLEATPEGLVCCQGWGEKLTCRTIPKEEIDLLEPRLVLQHGAEAFFEVAAVLKSGERVVLGENIPGLAVADTLARRIGAALQLYPEQVFTTAGSARRQLAPLAGLLGRGRNI